MGGWLPDSARLKFGAWIDNQEMSGVGSAEGVGNALRL